MLTESKLLEIKARVDAFLADNRGEECEGVYKSWSESTSALVESHLEALGRIELLKTKLVAANHAIGRFISREAATP